MSGPAGHVSGAVVVVVVVVVDSVLVVVVVDSVLVDGVVDSVLEVGRLVVVVDAAVSSSPPHADRARRATRVAAAMRRM